MPYQLSTNIDAGYVHLSYSGEIDLSERQQARKAVFAMCFEHGLNRSLVDLRDSDIRMSQSDVINFASSFKDIQLPLNYRLACVIKPENQTENLLEIIISIDGIDVKYFFNFDEAVQWLTAV